MFFLKGEYIYILQGHQRQRHVLPMHSKTGIGVKTSCDSSLLKFVFLPTKAFSLSSFSFGLKDAALYSAKNMKDSSTKHLSLEYIAVCGGSFSNLLAPIHQNSKWKMYLMKVYT